MGDGVWGVWSTGHEGEGGEEVECCEWSTGQDMMTL